MTRAIALLALALTAIVGSTTFGAQPAGLSSPAAVHVYLSPT